MTSVKVRIAAKRFVCRIRGHRLWSPMLGGEGKVRWYDKETGQLNALCFRCGLPIPEPVEDDLSL